MARKQKTLNHASAALHSAWLAWEAQQVIAMRLMRLAAGGPAAHREAYDMVAEKVSAGLLAAQMSAAAAARGAHDGGASDVLRMLRRRVRANHKRLSKGG